LVKGELDFKEIMCRKGVSLERHALASFGPEYQTQTNVQELATGVFASSALQ